MSKHFRIAARLPARLQESGIRLSAVLNGAGLSPDCFEQPRVLVTTEEFFALWRTIGTLSADPSIGLTLGTESRREYFDPVTLAALSSSSFGEAISQVARYKQLSCPEEICQYTSRDEWSIQFRWLLASDTEPPVLTDLCFAWLLNIARHGTGTRISPLRIELMRPSAYARAIEKHFGCSVRFNAQRNALVFHATDAALPFITRNAELLAMLAPQLDEELRQHRGQETFPEHVRASIQKKLAGRRPKMQEIARELHISARTLQRRLQEFGSSFQQVMEEARHQLARHYLSNPELELNEAAYLLGYEDSGSFIRAFRTWEGTPPAHWRETNRHKLASESTSPASKQY